MTNAVTANVQLPVLRLRLPGSWWQIPLGDRERARASIHDLVRTQVGTADDRATFRHDLSSRMLAALEQAIDGDGQSFHVALSIVDRLPIPATIAITLPQQGMTPAVGTRSESVMGILERGLELAAPESWPTAHRFQSRGSQVLRVHRHQLVDAGEGEALDTLVADYWITVPGTKRVLLVSCSTSLGPLEEVMLGFFDSIVRAAYWEHPST